MNFRANKFYPKKTAVKKWVKERVGSWGGGGGKIKSSDNKQVAGFR